MVIHVDLRLYTGLATCQILHVRLKYPHKRLAALKTCPWKNIEEDFFRGDYHIACTLWCLMV